MFYLIGLSYVLGYATRLRLETSFRELIEEVVSLEALVSFSICLFSLSFADSQIVFRVSVADLKRLKINMKIKVKCFKVLLWPKKNHHYTIKICRLQIWKKRCTLDGNLNMYYIWQNKAMNFLQILFKRQCLIVVLVLVILYCFEATSLIIFRFV